MPSKGRRELFVYECRGAGRTRREPRRDGFLGSWPEGPFLYLFFDREALSDVQEWLDLEKGWALSETYRLDYDQWQQISAGDLEVGPFVIRSADSGEGPIRSGKTLIRLDPGVVFGSGLHPTTRGCLLAIADLLANHSIRSVLDFGTGTGVLAIACALWGISRVFAVDCNPLAIRVARKNARLNDRVCAVNFLVASTPTILKEPCDLLLMNIEWPCLKETFLSTSRLNCRLAVVSGFLESQWDELKSILPPAAEILSRDVLEDWVTVVLRER